MKPGIYIAGSEIRGLAAALDPEILSGCSGAWEKDVSRFGPWVPYSHRSETGDRMELFRSESYAGSSTIIVTGKCTSSMDVSKKLIDEKFLPPWASILAVEQSAGRGQKKRDWVSPSGNIYGTWYWPVGDKASCIPSKWLPFASLLAGDIIASGLEERGISVNIKWPNDIIAGNRKLCGILSENRGGHLLVGVGLNVISAPGDLMLRNDSVLPAACLSDLAPGSTPLELWSHLVGSGSARLNKFFSAASPSDFVRLLERRIAWIGRRILVQTGSGESVSALLIGLAEDGGLRIRRKGSEETIYTGSILPDE